MPSLHIPTRAFFVSLLLPFVIVLLIAGSSPAQAMLPHDTMLRQMLDAIVSGSYDQFVAYGDGRFKSGFTPKMFEDLSRQLGPRLKVGYVPTFLTTLNQQEYLVYVWKIVTRTPNDDYLITLFVKDGNVSGFMAR